MNESNTLNANTTQNPTTQVTITTKKSMAVAFILTFLFGPLGMFYSTVAGAIVMFFVSLFAIVATGGLGLFITVPICIIWGMVAANKTNTQVVTTSNPAAPA